MMFPPLALSTGAPTTMIVQMLPVMSVKGLFLKNKKGSNSMPDIWKHDPMRTNISAIHLR